jgi:hypothetical protein
MVSTNPVVRAVDRLVSLPPGTGRTPPPRAEAIVGRFIFENASKAEFEDRLLAHLEHVITSKLRRGECFTFSWKEDISVGGGRTTIWVHPHANIVYKFHGGRTPSLNPAWLHALGFTASGPHGLCVVPEPDAAAYRSAMQPRPAMQFREVPADEPMPVNAG